MEEVLNNSKIFRIYQDCNCDVENGICIGFRDKKIMGIGSQDWTL